MSDSIHDILAKVPPGVSLARIAAVAGMNADHLSQIKSGFRNASPATLARLRLAVSRVKARQTEGEPVETALYRALLALSAQAMGLDPVRVQASDPAAKQVADGHWRAAAHARQLAQYLMNCGFGCKQAVVARACGVTRQAVSLAMREVEDQRERDPEFETLVTRLELAVRAVV